MTTGLVCGFRALCLEFGAGGVEDLDENQIPCDTYVYIYIHIISIHMYIHTHLI